jgi:hypothetical protein
MGGKEIRENERASECNGTESKEYVCHLLQTSKLYWNEGEVP